MSGAAAYFDELSSELGNGWNRFWFSPASPLRLGQLRIATGVLTLLYLLSWCDHLTHTLSSNGLLPPAMVQELLQQRGLAHFHPSPLLWIGNSTGLWVFQSIGLIAALLFMCGVYSRVTSVLTLLYVLSYIHRAPMLTGPAEAALVMLLAYLAIGPCGATYSYDAMLRQRAGLPSPTPSWQANVSLRLLQVHLAGFVALVACSMLASPVWWNGTAIWVLEAQALSRPFDLSILRALPKFVNGWTHLFVLANLLFPVLVWNRLARPLMLALLALFWLLMIPITGQALYVLSVVVALGAFIPAESSEPRINPKSA